MSTVIHDKSTNSSMPSKKNNHEMKADNQSNVCNRRLLVNIAIDCLAFLSIHISAVKFVLKTDLILQDLIQALAFRVVLCVSSLKATFLSFLKCFQKRHVYFTNRE